MAATGNHPCHGRVREAPNIPVATMSNKGIKAAPTGSYVSPSIFIRLGMPLPCR